MKITELIKKLDEINQRYGDKEVLITVNNYQESTTAKSEYINYSGLLYSTGGFVEICNFE